MAQSKAEMIEIFNVNTPGKSSRVQKDFYDDMRRALRGLVPVETPGMTQAEMASGVIPRLSPALFPDGEKSGWWFKGVQLDLEARNLLVRIPGKPTRWHRNPPSAEVLPVKTVETVIERREARELPALMRNLLETEGLLEAYQARPFYQRNDYIGWITDAKREHTREKRLRQMADELRDGDRYMNMAYKGK